MNPLIDLSPGYWRETPTGVEVACPKCREKIDLNEDYEISVEGEVHPSVVCTNVKCRFQKFVKLEGWMEQ